ncbi:cohesin domain-containing protein [Flavilitoribacter nigricans]|nr:cohesin domain-containing protein [Flavilitoribacter nigricans]
MKRLLIIMMLGFSAFVASAQPEIYMEDNTVDPGEEICVPIRGRFFTDIVTIQFSVNFDTEQLQFNSVGNFGIPSMSNANFDLTQSDNGIITFSWRDSRTCEDSNGGNPMFTIDNNEVLFEMCFTAKESAGYGDVTEIHITDNPLPIVVERLGSFSSTFGCNNLGFLDEDKDGVEPGIISISVRPVQVNISEEVGNAGDLVCVNFAASGFDNLQSMQFNVVWDSTVMELESIIPNGDIPNNGLSNFGSGGNIRANRLTYNWLYTIPDQPGVTLPDGTQLFQVCYRLLDNSCEKNSTVSIVSYPTLGIEVTNEEVAGFNIFFESDDGIVEVNDCDPEGIQVTVDCGDPVNLNDEICVPIRAGDNYNRVSSLEFILKWNSSILEFKQVNPVAPFWTNADFDAANAANGFLGVAWENSPTPPQDLDPGDIIFEVCYDVVGLGGNSPINVSTPWRGRSGNGPNIGVNPTNCEVDINQPDGVAISIGEGSAGPGDNFCVDFNVSGFQDITSLQFSLAYDPGLFQFTGLQNINIPGANSSNFNSSGAGSGSLFFDWESATPQNLADQTSAFQLCFTPLGDPGDCTALEGVNLPVQMQATTASSGDENIGLTIAAGELCTLFPDGFGLNIAEAEGDWLDTACVAVSVVEFDNITEANFCISWDPSSLEYTGINFSGAWTGLTDANIDASSANVGLLCIDWSGSELAIPDDTDIFDLCFKMIGDALECYDISMLESPAPTVTTANGPGSIVPQNGSLCVNDKFYIIDTLITPASCPGACDGSVEITVIGGQGQLGTIWFTEPNNQFNPSSAQNLCPGPLTFRISDGNSPSLVEEFTIEIPLADGVPEANAGEDLLLGCDPQSVLLSGTGSEGDFSYEWFRINSTGQEVSIGTNRSVVEFVPGTKIFRVTNNQTGCSSSDTTFVTAPEVPLANAGQDFEFTCAEGGFQLNGSGSDSGDNITYTWISMNNGKITEGQQTLINPQIEAPGSYILRVAYEDTGCFDADTVRVTDGRLEPDVVAGQDQILDCGIGTVTLSSLSNNPDLQVSYEWYDQNNQLLGTGETYEADQLGSYILLVRDNETNCSSTDTVRVLPDANYPDVLIDPALPITCIRDSVMISATVGPDTIDYTFTWTASMGGQLVPNSDTSLNPIALSPGTYTLAVTNTATGCIAEVDVVVSEDMTPPTAMAGEDQLITCETSSVSLSGAGSDTGDGFAYIWTNMEGDTVATTLMAEVSSPGTYTLEVTNLENGCTATDEVAVTLDGNVPQVSITGAQDITCEVTSVSLSGNITPAGPAYQYQWFQVVGGDAFTPVGDGTPNLTVTQPGVYVLEARNPADGCTGSNQVTINLNNEAPIADAGEASQMITCDSPTLTLSSTGSSEGETFTYEWFLLDGPSVGTGATLDVTEPGTYTLMVTNTETGCTATTDVEVVDGLQLPAISFSNPEPALDCINTSIEVEGLVDGATDLSVTWKGVDGGMPSPTDALLTTFSQAGTYRLVVENNLTGCVDSLELTVVDNSGNPPVVSIAEPIPFTCTTPTINLDASATGAASDFSSISWVSTDGNTVTPATGSLTVSVDGPGTYELTVVDANTGCAGTSMVTVVPDNDTPVAAAGADLGIECNETGVLDALSSSQGAQFSYEWVNLEGGAVPMPSDDLEASVTEPASYLLVVTNTDNGCVDTDTVTVSRIFPDAAAAGTDISLCQDETTASLSANLPTGTTGMWTSGGGASVGSTTDPATGVSGLQSGANVFTWTLSAPGCENYSQDQVTVYIETAPTAVEDLLRVDADDRSVDINVAQNDVLTNVDEYSVTLLDAPEFGTIDSFSNGRVYYSVPRGFVGITQVTYEICNLDCDDLCATGTLRIEVTDPDYEPTIMNTITPNGDGMNDNLVFDVLLFTPAEEFPDNEIIIFNRWGDIIFQQRPYNNDWNGFNNNGDRLPQGTYYYILRLNLADGVIIRGDVTILDNGER